MEDLKLASLLAISIFLIYLFHDSFLNYLIAFIAFFTAYITLKLGVKFGIRESYGRMFLFAGTSFLLWALSCIFYYINPTMDHALTFIGYITTIIALVVLHHASERKALFRSAIVPLTLYLLFLGGVSAYALYHEPSLLILAYHVFTGAIAIYLILLVILYDVGRISRGLKLILVSGILISCFYLIKPTFYSKFLEIIRIFAWCLNLFGAKRVSEDLYIPIF